MGSIPYTKTSTVHGKGWLGKAETGEGDLGSLRARIRRRKSYGGQER